MQCQQKQQQKNKNITNRLSKSNFVVFHMILLKTNFLKDFYAKDLIHPTWPLNKNRLKIQKRNYEYESYDQIEFIIKNMDASDPQNCSDDGCITVSAVCTGFQSQTI